MSIPLPPVPADDFSLPVPSSHANTPRASLEVLNRPLGAESKWEPSTASMRGVARHTLGIILLFVTVFLWTVSNFLASVCIPKWLAPTISTDVVMQTIFADNSYSKPYFVTYINSSFFVIFLVFVAARRLWESGGSIRGALQDPVPSTTYAPIAENEEQGPGKPGEEEEDPPTLERSPRTQLLVDDHVQGSQADFDRRAPPLNTRETIWLSLEFFSLWFLANYFIAACLEYTTVGSSTILTSTSSIFTLFIGAWLHVERFTVRKLIGVLASLAGIVLISTQDLTANNDKNRGTFPHKSHVQLAIGDGLALASALLYGIYTSLMKKRIADESRVDMMLFFGFVGLFNLIVLLPGFPILHFLGIETFEIPPTKRIMAIVLINSATSLVADFCWAYSMLLTSPLVTTVGLSLSIPLSLFGEIIINHQTSGVVYWLGACIVLLSFVFINYESTGKGDSNSTHDGQGGRLDGVKRRFTDAWDKFCRWRS